MLFQNGINSFAQSRAMCFEKHQMRGVFDFHVAFYRCAVFNEQDSPVNIVANKISFATHDERWRLDSGCIVKHLARPQVADIRQGTGWRHDRWRRTR
jgi:hypothetical protein